MIAMILPGSFTTPPAMVSTASSSPQPCWTQAPQQLAPGNGTTAVADALAWLQALAAGHGWSSRTVSTLLLCADEALANIAMHARRPDGERARIWLACGPTDAGVGVLIEDDGVAFNPVTQPSSALAASLDEAEIGGHGLRLLRHYLRQMQYGREAERNLLYMELEI
ncbi:ATP-binding protein [uncultured Comamonas sp.]|uniref:ATP-binding protein n=2 Tax=Comamonas TaxID=283 RepID=UPI002602AEF8|nr:ATP-binding protein [uncultured Comamonas sp.]